MTFVPLDIEFLLENLTLEEKISLLSGIDFWHTKAIESYGIPSITLSDGPNGIRGLAFSNSTPSNCFTCGTGLSSTFNKELLHEVGELMGLEAKIKGAHVILGPTCNIVRSPVGGRGFETYSEDPVLSGIVASLVINGIQSTKVLACIKHFVCNEQEHEKTGENSLVSERALREIYLKPFQLAIRDSNPKSLMTAYNKVNGPHVSEHKELLQDVVRKEWGYYGMIMSDWFGTYSIREALVAGLNLEMPGPARFRTIVPTAHEVRSKSIHSDVIDENVKYILQFINQAMESGIPENAEEKYNDSPEAKQLLRKVAGESIVLLKNENEILPLSKSATNGQHSIAIIGPNAKVCQDSGGGSASLNTAYKVTPFEGVKSKLLEGGNTVSLHYSLGAELDKSLPEAGNVLINDEGKLGILGKFYDKPASDPERKLLFEQEFNGSKILFNDFTHEKIAGDLFYTDFSARFIPEETATYNFGCSLLGTAQIFVDGQLVVDNKTKQVAGDAFFLGMGTREERGSIRLEKDKEYKVLVQFGSGPTYTLPTVHHEKGGIYIGIGLKIDPEQEIAKAVELAKSVDKVILAVGLSKEWETEGLDRKDMEIPGYTNKLITEVAKVNSQVIVVNQTGTPVTMPWVDDIQGLVQAWYGGNEAGNSIADVLFGDHNPSGKLSVTFPLKFEHNPSY